MKVLALVAVAALVATPAVAQRSTSVRGHVTKNGTYVMPHVRTTPNETRTDNWSSRPNTNPYTGKVGTVDPYAPKPLPTYPRGY